VLFDAPSRQTSSQTTRQPFAAPGASAFPQLRRGLFAFLGWIAFLTVASAFAQDTITNIMSPVVSFQYAENFNSEVLTNGGVQSPIVSFQYSEDFSQVALTNGGIQSPIVSYQYLENFSGAVLTNGGIMSPIVSYQYYEWPGDDVLKLLSSPMVSYIYGTFGTVTRVQVAQRAGTTLVDLFYDLSGADSAYSISVSVSSDGGVSFTLPATHFTGDGVTSPTAPGTGKHIVWDAGADLGQGYFPNVVVQVSAGVSSTASGSFAVNLRGLSGGLTVSGTVLDGGTGKPLGGASVLLGSASAQTDTQGSYQFPSVAVGDYTLTASLAGYATAHETISVTPGSSVGRVFTLQPLATPGAAPRVTSVTSKYPAAACYLDGVSFSVPFTATVDWAGHPPGTVQFIAPNHTYTVTASGSTVSQTLRMGSDFGANGRLRMVAVSTDGTKSATKLASLMVAPIPLPMVFNAMDDGSDFHYEGSSSTPLFQFSIGPGTISADIPVFGGADMSLGFLPEVDVQATSDGTAQIKMQWSDSDAGTVLDKEWETKGDPADIGSLLQDLLHKGALDPQQLPHASFGGLDLSFYPQLGGSWQYSADAGQWQWRDAFAGLAGDFSVSQTWPFLAGPVPMYASIQVGVEGDAMVHLLQLSPVNFDGELDVNPSLSGTLGVGVSGVLSADGTVTGDAHLDLQWPQTPTMKDFSLSVDASVSLREWIFHQDFPVYHWSWPTDPSPQGRKPRVLTQAAGWQPLGRAYLNYPSHGSFARPVRIREKHQTGGGSGSGVEVLLSPSIPYSDPNCSASGTNFCLAFITDNTNRTSMNRTMAMFTRFDGTNWSQPMAIADDGTADFHPNLLSFADGSAVAVWENEATTLPDSATLDEMKANLEISVAWFDAAAGAWLPAWQVTTNSFLDRSPRLAGQTKDNVLLTWVANPANDENGSTTAPNQIWSAWWNGTAWSSPQFAATVPNALLKYDLAYDGTNANLVMSVDTVSGSTNVNGHELFRVAFTSGTWGALTQLTADQVPDDNPQLALDAQGNFVLTWLKGAELSTAVNFAMTNRQVIRTNEYSSNLADFKLAASAGGRLALLWAEPSENSSDLFAMFYDPAALVWGAPKQLTHDPETERGTTAAFAGEGELVAVYDRTLLVLTNTPGTTLTALAALVYPLGEDLALDANLIYCSPPNPSPGGVATLHVKALNLGDQVETNVVVAFYRDVVQSGSELGRVTLTNALPPQGTNDVTFTWVVPDTSNPVAVIAVIDPDQTIPDISRSNNVVRLDLVKPNTMIQTMNWSPITTNLLAITVTVANDGAISNGPVTLSLRQDSVTGTNLFTQDIAALAPGESVDVSFVWDVAGQPDNLSVFAVLDGPGITNNFSTASLTSTLTISRGTPLQIGLCQYLADGSFQLTFYGSLGGSYTLQSSTNLNDWVPIQSFSCTNSPVLLNDASATNYPLRFYRVVMP
jgi:hypothetical protein